MVIQRIQTLYLLIAIALMVAFFFMPFGYTMYDDPATGQSLERSLKGIEFLGLLIPASLAILTMLIAIFAYKYFAVQKMMIVLGALLVGACIGVVIYILSSGFFDTNPDVVTRTVWGGGGLLLIAAWCAQWGAYRGIKSDERLLKGYDRLR